MLSYIRCSIYNRGTLIGYLTILLGILILKYCPFTILYFYTAVINIWLGSILLGVTKFSFETYIVYKRCFKILNEYGYIPDLMFSSYCCNRGYKLAIKVYCKTLKP